MELLIGRDIDRYHILEALGEGGMARVYKAYDTRLERLVAIKVIRREAFSPEVLGQVLARFEREAKALARLSHPNIVKVHDYGEYNGSPYLVMEYVPGGTLKGVIGKRVGWQEAVKLVLPVARALGYAHKQGIVHRDIKPANILMTESGEPMLSDFGIAKILEGVSGGTLTGTGVGIGTPEYMAPEQGMGKEIDGRADEYALGIVTYELFTGRRPYEADTPMAVILKHITDPLPSPRRFSPDLPEQLELVLDKALAKSPENRYPDLESFAAALDKLASQTTMAGKTRAETITGTALDQAVQAEHKPSKMDSRKWLFLGMGGLGLALVAGLAIVTTVWLRNTSSKDLSSRDLSSTLEANVPDLEKSTPSSAPLLATETSMTGLFTETAVSAAPTRAASDGEVVNPLDGAVLVHIPAGSFEMGTTQEQSEYLLTQCTDCELEPFSDSQPLHTVQLSGYWIYRTEVSNAMYVQCVAAGACQPPRKNNSESRASYYGNPEFANYPVIYVNWNAADQYCRWAGGRLPSEAEWEYGARGNTGWLYPWGDQLPNATLANVNNLVGDTTPVDQYPQGASPFGLLNMTGNVWEWVADWYQPHYYSSQSSWNDPQGPGQPGSTQLKSGRGGAYWISPGMSSAAIHDFYESGMDGKAVGFRCARSGSLEDIQLTPTPAASSWQQGKLVFVAKSGAEYALYTMNVGKNDPVQLLPPQGEAILGAPMWSPDNSRVAYSIYRGNMYVMEGISGATPKSLYPCAAPSWSPDGKQIICESTGSDEFVILDATTGALVRSLPTSANARLSTWSPMGDEIVYAELDRQQGLSSLWRISLQENSLPILLAGESTENYAPAWSPDGQWIAYQSNQGRALSDLWIMDRKGENKRRIAFTADPYWSRAPSWSPDGKWLAFVSNQAGSRGEDLGEVFVVSLQTGETLQLTQTGGIVYDWRVSWSR